MNNELAKRNKEAGLDVHIHVDAASGGFVAPFVKPDLVRDSYCRIRRESALLTTRLELEMGFPFAFGLLYQRFWVSFSLLSYEPCIVH